MMNQYTSYIFDRVSVNLQPNLTPIGLKLRKEKSGSNRLGGLLNKTADETKTTILDFSMLLLWLAISPLLDQNGPL